MTTMNTLTTAVTFDCADAASLASFWAALAGGSVADGATAEFAAVERDDGLSLSFNQVAEAKASKNRVHLDLTVDELAPSTSHAVSLGAELLADHDGWSVLRDPEGNEFCLVAG